MGALARRRMLAAALTTVLTTGIAPTISATTAPAATAATTAPAMGPIDPNTGFPFWYQDATGTKFQLCIDRTGDALCLADLPDKTRRPWVDEDPANTNFAADPEAFWSNATAKITSNGADALFVAAREAAFGGSDEAPRAGDQITFGRIRVRASNLVPGATYTVTHPYGTQQFVAEDGDGDPTTTHDGVIRYTDDLGCFDLPCDFSKADAQSPVTTYLRWNSGDAPAGYVGDPGVDHQVVGSPAGTNFFRIAGPDAGGNGVDTVSTDLFSVQGKLWQPTTPMLGIVGRRNLVDVGRALYTPSSGTATGAPTVQQTLTLTNAGGGTTPLQLGQLSVTGDDASAFDVVSNGCTASLAAGATCQVQIGFTPLHTGAHAAALVVPSNGADSTGPVFASQRILLRGDGGGTDKDLRAQGPLSLQTGYPLWYRDERGTQLALCDDPDDQMCLQPFAGPYDPAAGAMSLQTGNFPEEMFWWSGEAQMPTNSGFEARLVMAQEGAFVTGPPVDGDQITFGRIRIRVGGHLNGTYTVTTPYGSRSFTVSDQTDQRVINYTEDLGCLESPCDFSRVGQSNIGPFLTTADAPNGYVGDPNVDSAITNGPSGNVFRIDGPDIGGPGVNSVQTGQFAVSGKKWVPPAKGTLALQDSQSNVSVSVGSTRTLTLVNVGSQDAKVGRLTLSAGSAFSIVSDACSGATVPPNATCAVGVSLPSSASTIARDHLTVPDGSTTVPGRVLLNAVAATADPGAPDPGTPGTPAGPSVPDLAAADDTGFSNEDDVTSSTRLGFSGVAAGDQQVTLKVDGVSAPKQPVTPVNGVWSTTVDVKEGTHTVNASYSDGTTSAPLTVVVDQTRPNAPQNLALDPASDTGSKGDGVTTDLTPTVNGTTTPGDAHDVQLFANGRLVGTAPVNTDGTWAVTTSQLTPGKADLRASALDAAGNVSGQSRSLKLDLRLVAPASLAVAGTGAVTATGTATDVARPTITGTTAPATLVRVLVDGAVAGQGSTGAAGRFAVNVGRLAPGTHTVAALAVDSLGRRLSLPARFRLRVDLRDPVVGTASVRPVRHVRLARRLPRMVPNVVTWSGRDAASGIARYRLQVSRDGAPFADVVLPRARATRVRQDLHTGVGYVYRVRAVDRAGNASAWTRIGQVRPELLQQSSSMIDYVGRWIRKAAAFASGRSLRFARRDASATLTTRATSVTWVTSTGPHRGLAAVLVDGRRVRTVDLYSPHGSHRLLLVTVDGLPEDRRSHVEVRVLGDKRPRARNTRVDVDAFIVQR